jgi:hypothetical protein
MKKQYRDFESAREFARSLGLKNQKEWREYCKSGNKPDGIPVAVEQTYKKDFKGMGDWLGTGNVGPKDKVFHSFTEAREFARSLGLKNYDEWREYVKSGDKPADIPNRPDSTYKNEGWTSLGDWLGTGRTRDFRSFTEAKEFVRSLGLKNANEWEKYCKSGNKPADIPNRPDSTYKNEGWTTWVNWLGNEWRSFTEAREFARSLGLKNNDEWKEYCKSGNKPDDIPADPRNVYNKWKKK